MTHDQILQSIKGWSREEVVHLVQDILALRVSPEVRRVAEESIQQFGETLNRLKDA